MNDKNLMPNREQSPDEARKNTFGGGKLNNSNLIPNSERSQEELREMGRKGGIASGKARRKKRQQMQAVKWIIELFEKGKI